MPMHFGSLFRIKSHVAAFLAWLLMITNVSSCVPYFLGGWPAASIPILLALHRRLQRKARPPAQRPVDKRPQDKCTCNSISSEFITF